MYQVKPGLQVKYNDSNYSWDDLTVSGVPFQTCLTSSDSSTSAITRSYITREWLHLQGRATGPTSHQTAKKTKTNHKKITEQTEQSPVGNDPTTTRQRMKIIEE